MQEFAMMHGSQKYQAAKLMTGAQFAGQSTFHMS